MSLMELNKCSAALGDCSLTLLNLYNSRRHPVKTQLSCHTQTRFGNGRGQELSQSASHGKRGTGLCQNKRCKAYLSLSVVVFLRGMRINRMIGQETDRAESKKCE